MCVACNSEAGCVIAVLRTTCADGPLYPQPLRNAFFSRNHARLCHRRCRAPTRHANGAAVARQAPPRGHCRMCTTRLTSWRASEHLALKCTPMPRHGEQVGLGSGSPREHRIRTVQIRVARHSGNENAAARYATQFRQNHVRQLWSVDISDLGEALSCQCDTPYGRDVFTVVRETNMALQGSCSRCGTSLEGVCGGENP